MSPIYADLAKGCRIWDIDGNEYVDWTSAIGPIILGYADEVVDAVVREQMSKGSIYSSLHIRSLIRVPRSFRVEGQNNLYNYLE